jgi:hypothetical protein
VGDAVAVQRELCARAAGYRAAAFAALHGQLRHGELWSGVPGIGHKIRSLSKHSGLNHDAVARYIFSHSSSLLQ